MLLWPSGLDKTRIMSAAELIMQLAKAGGRAWRASHSLPAEDHFEFGIASTRVDA